MQTQRQRNDPSTPASGDPNGQPDFLARVPKLEYMWDFVPSRPKLSYSCKRLYAFLRYAHSRPAHTAIKPLDRRPNWLVYFAYCPKGRAEPHHHFTLERLKDLGLDVFIVCACPSVAAVPEDLHKYADALYWKDLAGYDFSAYTLALEVISDRSPGATAFILNDSVFGPFVDLRPFLKAARWDLTGFTASALEENHIQSYAFILRDVTAQRLDNLRSIFYRRKAFSYGGAAIWCQETRLARIAHRTMSVGAYLYSNGKYVDDPCLRLPFNLLDAGFPFLKRSLLDKMRHFQDPAAVRERLAMLKHPLA